MVKKDKLVIVKVWKRHKLNQKMITVPKDCDIEEGDFVHLLKVKK